MVMSSAIDVSQKRKKRLWRYIGIGFVIVILLLVTIVAWGWTQIGAGVPTTQGQYEIDGINSEVNIYRDDYGVPHIEADTEYDLYFAQGFVTAQDRMFQMDLSRRQASGMLSEVIGESALDADRYFRTFGLRRAAEASYPEYGEGAQQALYAYADGVNAYLSQMNESGDIPVEFRLLGYSPEPWEPLDSLTIGKYMAYDLGGTWQGQAFRYWLLNNVSEEEAIDLMPTYKEDGPIIMDVAKNTDVDVLSAFEDVTAYLPEPFNGSNNWVISGDHTITGAPLLADDPHLGLATPSIWYETHLHGPEVNVTGVIFAGVPGIILGHNEEIAWGVTNVGPDVQELYLEKRNPEDPYQFLYEDEWYDADVVIEEIVVDGYDEPVQHEVVVTRHGPLLSEYSDPLQQEDVAMALRWTAHEPTKELEAILEINKASDWESFLHSLESFSAPAQNFVYADRDGNIGYRANGKIPIRENSEALFPVEGWTGEHDWERYIPFDELPTLYNPDSGMISTANNKIVTDDYPYHLSHTWAQPYRHDRILQLLDQDEPLTKENMMDMQMDAYNLHAEEFLPDIVPLLSQDGLREIDLSAVDVIHQWNYEDVVDEGGPLIFHLWFHAISDVLFEDTIPEEMMAMFEGRTSIIDQLLRDALAGEPGPWIENVGSLEALLTESFQRAVDQATDLQGNDPSEWTWGEYHQVTFAHPLSVMSPLDLLFNPTPTPVDGSRITVMAAGYNNETGATNHGAGWRGVMDLSDLTESYHIVGPGQSGHVRSEHYGDQLLDWVNGDYHTTSLQADVYQSGDHLKLLPTSP
ncbi:beta-lactam antibiotic acylase [Bacillaceae bacterium JMAK1]|nr:beta-lactam antibiotic acylase [Bacillaceae bacterium JMAK1]